MALAPGRLVESLSFAGVRVRAWLWPRLGAWRAAAAAWLAGLRRTDLAFLLGLLAVWGVLVWNARGYWPQLVDDAGITFSYARTFGHGQGMLLAPGAERVEGSTSLLWTLVLVPVGWLGLSFVTSAKVLGLAFAALALALVALFPARLWGRPRAPSDLAVPLVAALVPNYAQWAVNGLENGLMAAVIAWALLATAREAAEPERLARPLPASVLACVLLAACRPDGILYVAVLASVKVLSLLQPGGRRQALRWLALVAGILAALEAARLLYFAAAWPNTYYAKRATEPLRKALLDLKSKGWTYSLEFLRAYRLEDLLPLGLLVLLVPRRWLVRLSLVGFGVAGLLFPVVVGGDWMVEWRFFSFAVPILLLAIAEGIRVLAFPARLMLRTVGFDAGRALAALSAVALVWFAGPHLARRPAALNARSTTYGWVEHRAWYLDYLRQRLALPWDASVLDVDMGAMSFSSGLRMIDLMGLVDYAVARGLRDSPVALRDYLFGEQRPTFIHLHGPWLELGVQRYEEVTQGYFALPLDLAGKPKEAWEFVAPLLRREAVAPPWRYSSEPLPDPCPGSSNAAIRGYTLSHRAVEPGGQVLVDLAFTGGNRPVGVLEVVSPGKPRPLTLVPALAAGVVPARLFAGGERPAARVRFSPPPGRSQISWRSSDGAVVPLFEVQAAAGAGAAETARLGAEMDRLLAAGQPGQARALAEQLALRRALDPRDRVVRALLARRARALVGQARRLAAGGAWQIAAALAGHARQLVGPDDDDETTSLVRKLAGGLASEAARAERRGELRRAFTLAREAVGLDPRLSWSRRRAERLRQPTLLESPYDGGRSQQAYRMAVQAGEGKGPADPALVLLGATGRFVEAADLARALGVEPTVAPARAAVARGLTESGVVPPPSLLDPCLLAADPELGRALRALAVTLPARPQAVGCPASARPEAPFDEDSGSFEGKGFGSWVQSGEAFRGGPVSHNRLPDNRLINGWAGSKYVDSFVNGSQRGDGWKGKLASPPFTISSPGLSFLVAGGAGKEVGVRLLVDGKVVREARGANDLCLRRVFWDLTDQQGKRGRLEIYDDATAGWGHIRVDDFKLEPVGVARN